MTEPVFTLIGDLVGSRTTPDRFAVQGALHAALEEVNAHLTPQQRFEPTVGDEYQGACSTLADAARAALLVRLALLPGADARCGIGHGEVTVHDASRRPLLQDGPGWWSARAAIESLAVGRGTRRTAFSGPDAPAVNAFLLCRDQLVEHLNDRGRRILRLALLGHPQKDIAQIEQVTRSAVSQQFSRGVGAIVDAHRILEQQGER
jgi:SatD family (SatD)